MVELGKVGDIDKRRDNANKFCIKRDDLNCDVVVNKDLYMHRMIYV